MGYTRELPIERWYREVRLLRIFEGTDEMQRLIISRDLLTGHVSVRGHLAETTYFFFFFKITELPSLGLTYANRRMLLRLPPHDTAQMVWPTLARRTAMIGLGGRPARRRSHTRHDRRSAAGAAPTVNAGVDQVLTVADRAFLNGQVSDDGVPDPSRLSVAWNVVSGPGMVTVAGRGEPHTSATFSAPGYVLRLTVGDGGVTASDELTVTVRDSAASVLRVPGDYPTIQAALDAAPVRGLCSGVPRDLQRERDHPADADPGLDVLYDRRPVAHRHDVIRGPLSGTDTVFVSAAAGPETRVVGFTVRAGKDGIEVAGNAVIERNTIESGSDAVDFPKGSAGLVHHNTMRNNGDDGVDVDQSSVVITDNLMQGNAGDGVEARLTNVTAPLRELVIRGNRILQSRQDGLQFIDDDAIGSASTSATLVTVDRNVIAGNREAGIGLMDGAQTSEDYRGASLVERITVTNNTFDGNNHGITGGDNLVAINNIFARHVGPALKNVDGASRVAYSQFFSNGAPNSGSNVDAATSYTGDPLLDASYAPLPGSPVVDAGTASYTLPSGELAVEVTDFSGVAPDIGAVESSGSGGPVNRAPVVDAGPDSSVTLPAPASLAGAATDDGLPAGSSLAVTWSASSGPGTVLFADANTATTTASFSAAGDYVLRLTATDGELSSSDTVAIAVAPEGGGGGATTVTQAVVSAGSDDAEESSSGSVELSSSDLELVTDGSSVQTVGLRFTGVQVPRGAQVTAATVQFQTDEVSTAGASITIRGEATDSPGTFTTAARNVSGRPRTAASVTWTPSAWPTVGAHGVAERTADLAPVLQELVNRPGWSSGNAIVLVLTGSGRRTAEAFESGAASAPRLEITWRTGGGAGTPNTAPVVDAGPDRAVTLSASASLAGTVTDDGLPAGGVLTALWSSVSGPGTVTFANATAAATTASFSAVGAYVLRLSGSDGELSSSDTLTVTVSPQGGGGTVVVTEARVAASTDDAEERANGSVSLDSGDLELVVDGSNTQTVGLRFPVLSVPAGSTVVRAWIQFSTDENKSAATTLALAAHAADNAPTFVNTSRNVSSRPRTSATVAWSPVAWSPSGSAGRPSAPDLAVPLQEVVSRAGWTSGNAVVFVITGTGTRTAYAFDGSPARAPVLHVEYQL